MINLPSRQSISAKCHRAGRWEKRNSAAPTGREKKEVMNVKGLGVNRVLKIRKRKDRERERSRSHVQMGKASARPSAKAKRAEGGTVKIWGRNG